MRRSIRLKGYDYSRAGAYFVTICVRNKQCLFGHIENTDMLLNEAGKMVQTVWNKIPQYYKSIEIDAFTIMPNHIHGIIRITNQDNFNMSQNITKSVGVELGRTGLP